MVIKPNSIKVYLYLQFKLLETQVLKLKIQQMMIFYFSNQPSKRLSLGGTITYHIQNQDVVIQIEEIRNDSFLLTGTLLLQLITIDQRVNGSSIPGSKYDVIASKICGQIKPFYYHQNITLKLPIKHSFCRKYTALLLKQFQNNTFVYIDWCNFSKENVWNSQKTLYHGTTKQNAQKIKKHNFFKFSKGGRLGPGIYFTEKFNEAKKIGQRFDQPASVIECKVKGYWVKDLHPDWAGIGHNFIQYCVPNNKFIKIIKVHNF